MPCSQCQIPSTRRVHAHVHVFRAYGRCDRCTCPTLANILVKNAYSHQKTDLTSAHPTVWNGSHLEGLRVEDDVGKKDFTMGCLHTF